MIISYKSVFLSAFFLLFSFSIKAQTTTLDKKVSITLNHTSTKQALKKLEERCGVYFTYNPSQIDLDKVVSGEFSNKSLKFILKFILGEEAVFKQLGKNIIIRMPTSSIKEPQKKSVIYGTVVNANTGDNLENVSVFQVDKKKPILSNQESYSLEVKDKEGYVELSFNKKDYKDTIVIVQTDALNQTNIQLSPLPLDTLSKDTLNTTKVENLTLVKSLTNTDQLTHSENITNYSINRFFQASLIPFISTNGKMNAYTTSNFSINLFAGYSGGVNGFELGGFANINRNEMEGVQVAGISNVVGGEVDGLQLAGIMNVTLDTMRGVQAAGILNSSIGTLKGTQLSGVVNSTLKDSKGFQGAGSLNLAWEDFNGIQLSGGMNFTRHDVDGFQGAAAVNYARDVNGMQIAIFNRARNLKGLQLGLVNVSSSVKGASIGLLSFVKNGYQSIDLATSDVYSANLSFKTGTKRFYNIVNIGAVSTSEKNIFAAGYGLGTQIPFGKNKWSFDWDNTFNFFLRLIETPTGDQVNFLFNSDLFLSRVLSDHFTFRTGVTFNSYLRYNDVQISFIPSERVDSEEGITEEWLGYKVAMAYRF